MDFLEEHEIRDLLVNSSIGLWRVEFSETEPPRFFADEVMDELLGLDKPVTPEERYAFHHSHIHPLDIKMFEDYAQKLPQGRAEIVYRYNHPFKGEMYVRCSGSREKRDVDFVSISGTHQDISDTIRLEKRKTAETRLAERTKTLTEQLNIIQTIAKVFNSIYYIDMSDYSFVEIGANLAGLREVVGVEGNAVDAFDVMCKKIILPEYVDEMREFVDLSTINDRLRNREWISTEFQGNLAGWSEGCFIAANRDAEGNCDHIIWATRSVDEIKQKEIRYQNALKSARQAAEAANDAKSAFLFNMSHDIRTPMNAIIGFTNLLEKNQNDPVKRMDYLHKIRNSSEFLLSLINNVLEMARIESGNAVIDENVWSAEAFNDTLFDVFEELMKQKKIKFVRSINVQHKYVYCDAVKLRELFLNILSNAYKYTPYGGEVSMDLLEIPSDREGYALFQTTISDTGIGMSEEYLPHLFEDFSREQSATDSKIEGTGLGMSIVKKLVELMGGSISVTSKQGEGSTFVVSIYHRISDEHCEKVEVEKSYDISAFEGKRILLAEDNDLNAEIVIEIVGETGIVVDRVDDGEKCLKAIMNSPAGYYDLILMDIQMPNMNGYQATAEIRKLEDSKKAYIPIVAMTANAFEEDKRAALENGMNAHLSKPMEIDTLFATMARLL